MKIIEQLFLDKIHPFEKKKKINAISVFDY